MIRALIRWLARVDIEAAYEAGFAQGQLGVQSEVDMACCLASARGRLEGRTEALEAVENAVAERYGANVESLDVARARKVLLH